MTDYSVADAKNHLSKLIDRALEGEAVTITRHGRQVVEIRPVQPPLKRVTAAGLAWLAENRLVPDKPFPIDSTTLIRQMRDEDWA